MKKLFTLFLLLNMSIYCLAQDFNAEHFKSMKARNIGPAGMSGRVTAIDVDLSDQAKIFVGTASGGVWVQRKWRHIMETYI